MGHYCRLRITLLFGLIGCILIEPVAGDVCLPTWQKFDNQLSLNGVSQHIENLADCLIACQYSSTCVAIDYDNNTSPPCWIHTDPQDLVGDNVYSGASTQSQYVINRTCESLATTDCQLNWQRLPGTHSLNAISYNYWTEYDCFTYCRYTDNCVAADFDITTSPPCWIHTSYDDLTPDNTYMDSTTAVQYQMNRTCPAPASLTGTTLSGCTGQLLRNGSWCPSGQEIHILSAFYKIHPLCCNGPAGVIDVPDSTSLVQFSVFDLDDVNYISKIESCEGEQSCNVMSKVYESPDINNDFCPAHPDRTNFVSLSYDCQAPGHTDASTSKSPTSFQFPTQSMTSAGKNSGTTAASTSNQPNNKDALILGAIGVAFGGLSILIILVFVILWFLRRNGEAWQPSNGAMNPTYSAYDASTSNISYSTSRGRQKNQLNGVSTVVLHPDEDVISN